MEIKKAYDYIKENPEALLQAFRERFAPLIAAAKTSTTERGRKVSLNLYKSMKLMSDHIVRNLLYLRASSDPVATRKLNRVFGENRDEYGENVQVLEAMKSHLKSTISRIDKDFTIDKMEAMTDEEFSAKSPLFTRYVLMAVLADEIKAELPQDDMLNTYLEELRNSPAVKYMTARLNIMANPIYTHYYNDGRIYKDNPEQYDPEIHPRESDRYVNLFSDLSKNLRSLQDIVAHNKSLDYYMWEPLANAIPDPPVAEFFRGDENIDHKSLFFGDEKLAIETATAQSLMANLMLRLNDIGKTQEQIDAMTFYDHNGKKLGDIGELAYAIIDSEYNMPYFFAHIEGQPMEVFPNTLAAEGAPKMPGDPFNNILLSEIQRIEADYRVIINMPDVNEVDEDARIENDFRDLVLKYTDFLANIMGGAYQNKDGSYNNTEYAKNLDALNTDIETFLSSGVQAYNVAMSERFNNLKRDTLENEYNTIPEQMKDSYNEKSRAQIRLIADMQKYITEKQDILRAFSQKGVPSANLERYKARLLRSGYSEDEIGKLRFYDSNGRSIGDITKFALWLPTDHYQKYAVACLPGKDTLTCNISADPSFTLDNRVHYRDTFNPNIPELPEKIKNAHILGGSSQYARMEALINEYNMLMRPENFNGARAAQLIERLEKAATAYLDFKESQRGKGSDQLVHGKNAREQRRIDLAYDILNFASPKREFAVSIRSHAEIEYLRQKFPDINSFNLSSEELTVLANTYTNRKQEIDSQFAPDSGKVPFSADRYPATDPAGKRSELDFEAASRIANIRAFASSRPAVKPLVDTILNDASFNTLLDNAVTASVKFNPLSAIISRMPEGEKKENLQAVYDKLTANDNDISAFRDHLTMLEYAAGVRRGPAPESNASILASYAEKNTINLPEGFEIGNSVHSIIPTPPDTIIADFHNLEACLNARDLITLKEKNDAITNYLAETTNRVLDPLFSHLNPDFDRYNYVIVDGKSVHERIIDRYFETRTKVDNADSAAFNFYIENKDKLAAEMIGTALMAGKSVQVYVPDGLGIVGNKPVDIKKAGYVPSKKDSDIINYFNEAGKAMGFKKKDPDLAARNERAFKIVQGKNLTDSIDVIQSARHFNTFTALWKGKLPTEQTIYSVGRSFVTSLGMAMLIKAGHSIKDVADHTKLVKEKQDIGLHILELVNKADIDTLNNEILECIPIVSEKFFDEFNKLDWTDPEVLKNPENRHLFAMQSVFIDLDQEADRYREKTADFLKEKFPGEIDYDDPDAVKALKSKYCNQINDPCYFMKHQYSAFKSRAILLDGVPDGNLLNTFATIKSAENSLKLMKNVREKDHNNNTLLTITDDKLSTYPYECSVHVMASEDILEEIIPYENDCDFMRGLGLMELDGKITKQIHIQHEVTEKGFIDFEKGITVTSNINVNEVAAANKNSLKAQPKPKSRSKQAENNLEHAGRPSQQERNIDQPVNPIMK